MSRLRIPRSLTPPLTAMSQRRGFLPYLPWHPWELQARPNTPGTVSVIVPAYNAATTLPEALRSCEWQTYLPDEVVIVDDASTDGTWDCLADLSGLGISTRCLQHKVNRGASAARNHAIRQATGEFLIFMDADDMMPEYRIADTLEEFRETGASLIYGQKRKWRRHPQEWEQDSVAVPVTPQNVVGAAGCGTCAVALRRDACIEQGVWLDESMVVAEDAELLVACLSRDLKVHCSPKVYCWRRDREDSLRTKGDWYLMRQWIVLKHRRWLSEYVGHAVNGDEAVRGLRLAAGWMETEVPQ
jgi:glycosyltransferase involved in cell wall biosynthesis